MKKMGPATNGPRSVSCDRAIGYSGFGVHSVCPVGDFLDWIVLHSTFRVLQRRANALFASLINSALHFGSQERPPPK